MPGTSGGVDMVGTFLDWADYSDAADIFITDATVALMKSQIEYL
jgi:hypothetical protein